MDINQVLEHEIKLVLEINMDVCVEVLGAKSIVSRYVLKTTVNCLEQNLNT